MSEEAKTPPSGPPSEQDIKEFQKKFDEFFETLSEREKLQAASLVTLAAQEDGVREAEQVGENSEAEPLSEKEIEEFLAKLQKFHDDLPDGQHEIIGGLYGKGIVHAIPEDQRDEVEGHWLSYDNYINVRNLYYYSWVNYYARQCYSYGGTAFRKRDWNVVYGGQVYDQYTCYRGSTWY